MHPKSWLSKYQRNSYRYLVIMFFFYVTLGYAATAAYGLIIDNIEPDYKEPKVKVTLLGLLNAGPFEESLAFGMPFYYFGNVFVVLGTGIVWAFIHILNTESFTITNLAYGNVIFALFYLFFSLRTWASGMGWFSILTHSSYDGSAFVQLCALEGSCDLGSWSGLFMVALSLIFLFVTYYLYRRRKTKMALHGKTESERVNNQLASPIFPPDSSVVCSACGSQSHGHTEYCYQCGQTLKISCVLCKSSNSIYAKYCSFCGSSIKKPLSTLILGRLSRPSRKRASVVVIICFASLFLFPLYVSIPIIIATIGIAIARKS
jgi:hypothetical protein